MGCSLRSRPVIIVVIPVNTTFETHVSRRFERNKIQLVADSTLHGQWLTRMLATDTNEKALAKRISRGLARQGLASDGQGEYPIGSIAEIETDNAVYYLLTVSRFDAGGVAWSTQKDVERALESLALHYDKRGQGNPLYLPLIGTGRSRSGLTPQESLDLAEEVLTQNSRGLYGKVRIVVLPENAPEVGLEGD